MKKQIFSFIFALAVSVFINATQANAQSNVIRVDVPFAFNANNKTLPAGTYTLYPRSDNRVLWRLENAGQKPDVQLMAGSLSGASEVGNVRMTFRRYGDQHFLIGFKTASYEVGLRTSRSEKNIRRSWDDLTKYDVVTLETVGAVRARN